MLRYLATTVMAGLLFGTVTYAPSANAAFKRYDRSGCLVVNSMEWDCPIVDDTALPKGGAGGITSVNVHHLLGTGNGAVAEVCVHFAWTTGSSKTCSGLQQTFNFNSSPEVRVLSFSGSALSLWTNFALDGFGYIRTTNSGNTAVPERFRGYFTSN